jgi:hypothetical protein
MIGSLREWLVGPGLVVVGCDGTTFAEVLAFKVKSDTTAASETGSSWLVNTVGGETEFWELFDTDWLLVVVKKGMKL